MATSKEITRMKLELNQVTRTKSILNQNQIQKLWNSTKGIYKYSRPAKGGGTWTYVKASYVRKVLDSVYGFNWDFEVDTSLGEAYEVAKTTGACIVKGTLVCRAWYDGSWVPIKKTQFGRAEVKFKKEKDEFGQRVPLDFGNDMKAAATDCLKKCASLLGVAQDVYEADEFIDIEIIGSDESSPKAKLAKKRLEKAKASVSEESEAIDGNQS